MTECKFNCAQCGRHLKIDQQFCGKQIRCPACNQVIGVPLLPAAAGPESIAATRDWETIFDPRVTQPDQARSAIYWRRTEPPTSSCEQTKPTDPPEA